MGGHTTWKLLHVSDDRKEISVGAQAARWMQLVLYSTYTAIFLLTKSAKRLAITVEQHESLISL